MFNKQHKMNKYIQEQFLMYTRLRNSDLLQYDHYEEDHDSFDNLVVVTTQYDNGLIKRVSYIDKALRSALDMRIKLLNDIHREAEFASYGSATVTYVAVNSHRLLNVMEFRNVKSTHTNDKDEHTITGFIVLQHLINSLNTFNYDSVKLREFENFYRTYESMVKSRANKIFNIGMSGIQSSSDIMNKNNVLHSSGYQSFVNDDLDSFWKLKDVSEKYTPEGNNHSIKNLNMFQIIYWLIEQSVRKDMSITEDFIIDELNKIPDEISNDLKQVIINTMTVKEEKNDDTELYT